MPSYTGVNRKQQEQGRCKNCLKYIWNSEEKTLLGRKISHWGALILFYIVFLGCVLGVLFLLIWILVYVVSGSPSPWLQGKSSPTGSNPGLGFRPLLHLSSPVIWYTWDDADKMSYKDYVREIDRFFRVYRKHDPSEYTDCSAEILPQKRSKPCLVNLSHLGACATPNYGYDNLAPCVYIKLNKIYGWTPESYNKSSNLPSNMPAYLRKHITETIKGDVKQMNTVWLSCEGYYPSDTQHMGNITMFPRYGFPAAHFPYLGQKAYVSPLVAIKFTGILNDTLITVHCRTWAQNIPGAAVEFQLMVGSKEPKIVW